MKLTECYLGAYNSELYFECEAPSGKTFTNSIRLNELDFDRIDIGDNATEKQVKDLEVIARKLNSLVETIKVWRNNENTLKVDHKSLTKFDQILTSLRYKKYDQCLSSLISCLNVALLEA